MVNRRPAAVTGEAAISVALDALIWLAARPDDLSRFAAEAGADAAAIRALADDSEGLGFLLDWLLRDEALVVAFAADSGVDPALPARARNALPGGESPHWT
jgi:hypothetical protein